MSGALTTRLVTPEVMADALRELLRDANYYAIAIKRWRIDFTTGNLHDVVIVLREESDVFIDSNLKPSFLRSRNVTLYLETADNGIAFVNLTTRQWSKLAPSVALDRKLIAFNETLLSGAASGILTAKGAGRLAWAPFALILSLIAGYSISRTPGGVSESQDPPHWLHVAYSVWLYGQPICLLAALAIFAFTRMSTGLRLWPRALTRDAIWQLLFRARTTSILTEPASKIFYILVGALIAAVISFWVRQW